MPDPLSEEELEEIVDDVIAEVGATSIRDLGRVMADVMPQVSGRADGSTRQPARPREARLSRLGRRAAVPVSRESSPRCAPPAGRRPPSREASHRPSVAALRAPSAPSTERHRLAARAAPTLRVDRVEARVARRPREVAQPPFAVHRADRRDRDAAGGEPGRERGADAAVARRTGRELRRDPRRHRSQGRRPLAVHWLRARRPPRSRTRSPPSSPASATACSTRSASASGARSRCGATGSRSRATTRASSRPALSSTSWSSSSRAGMRSAPTRSAPSWRRSTRPRTSATCSRTSSGVIAARRSRPRPSRRSGTSTRSARRR